MKDTWHSTVHLDTLEEGFHHGRAAVPLQRSTHSSSKSVLLQSMFSEMSGIVVPISYPQWHMVKLSVTPTVIGLQRSIHDNSNVQRTIKYYVVLQSNSAVARQQHCSVNAFLYKK